MLSGDRYEETGYSLSQQAPEPQERRSAPRHLSILRVGALVSADGRELCLVRNISAGGIMAHVYSRHAPGEEVAVELKSNEPIAGKIVWVEESNVGIQFDAPITVADMLSNQTLLDNGMRPRMPRVEVDRLATLRCGAQLCGVNTRDISQGGVKIECDRPLEPGAQVVLTLERFRPIQGSVRWYADGLAGISFHQPIPFGELMAWLKPRDAA